MCIYPRMQFVLRSIAVLGSVWMFAGWASPTAAADHDEVVVSLGAFDMVRHDDDSGYVGVDYLVPGVEFWRLRPWAGLLSTSDRALWGGGGVYLDWEVTPRVRLTPSFGGGYYEKGEGKDLGHSVEFRSQLGISYLFGSQARIGLTFGHLSNGGLAENNKGTEYLNVSYTLPIGRRLAGPPAYGDQGTSTGRRTE